MAALTALLLALAAQEPSWYKGNTHAHTLWDNGDARPEVVVDWYRSHGYHFVVLSDHNEKNALSGKERLVDGVALQTFDQLVKAFSQEGRFALLPGEEIGDSFQGLLIHHTVINPGRILLPPGGESVRDVMVRALAAVDEESKRVQRPLLAHLNHPNLGWAVGASDLASTGERFFEIYNGHPSARNGGDATHPSTEEMWDRALTERLRAGRGPLLYGIAADDAHHYSGGASGPGKAWVMVRAKKLAADEIVKAMLAGDFYSTTGVTLTDVRADPSGLRIAAAADSTIRFIGSGRLLQESKGSEATYRFAGDELYVRAVVTSADGKTAWTQPVLPPPIPRCAEGWTLELVARAPRVRHPSVVCCAPDGRVFVGEDPIDMEGPIDQPVDRILCLHPDGRTTVFAEGLGPVFGMTWLEGRLYVQHVPKFSVFRDADGIGRDRVDLLECTNPTPSAGNGLNDHIPANFHLAMDGYFYVAVGQKGIYGAVGRDGERFDMREGGVLRMRPDGTGLEVVARGVRNIMDVALTSEDDLFAYDNDDHTKAWKVKLLHMVEGGWYGFPWDIKPLRPWTLGGIQEFPGGAPTGVLAYTEDALPAEYRDNLLLCDWGRRTVVRVRLARDGATYKVLSTEDLILPGPDDFRPVGITTTPDGLGFYITDWNFPGWKRRKDDAGRLWKLTWQGASHAAPRPGRDLEALSHPSREVRLAAQRRLVEHEAATDLVEVLRHSPSSMARIHTLWGLDAIDGGSSERAAILEAARGSDAAVRRQAIRQLGRRRLGDARDLMTSALRDADAAVRFEAATALGRIGVAPPLDALDDADAVVRHAVVAALQRSGTWDAILPGLDDPRPAVRDGTLFALREAYDERVVRRLAALVDHHPLAIPILRGLERKAPPWDGRWWRNGPDAFAEDNPKVGPKIDRTIEWAGTPLVREALRNHPEEVLVEPTIVAPIRRPTVIKDPAEYVAYLDAHSGDASRGRTLFLDSRNGCIRCHRLSGKGGDLGPDLAGIGAKYGRATLVESLLYPSRQIAEGYAQTVVRLKDGRVISGLLRGETRTEVVLVDGDGTLQRLKTVDIDGRKASEISFMPEGLQSAFTPSEFADVIAFLQSLQEAEGYVPLFNGKDLSGWKLEKANEGHWTVQEGGVLRYDCKGKDLWTEKSYGDFVLRAEWRFPGSPVEKEAPVILADGSVSSRTEKVLDAGDSGIFLRGSQKSQVNLWCWPIGSGEIYGYRTDMGLPPEVRAGATPKLRADKPPGEWNRLEITMKGERLTVVLNGKTVIDQARLPGVPAKGPIGLQHPGKPLSPGMPVEFARLSIKELAP